MLTLQPRLIALDLDGTLLGLDGQISPRNGAALRAAERAGITVVIATGRRHVYALKVLRSLALAPETPLVSSNGAVVRDLASRLIERTHMHSQASRELCAHLGGYRNALVVTFDRTTPEGEDVRGSLVVEDFADLHQSIGKWMEANEPWISHVNPIELCLQDAQDPPLQMMLCGTVERMRAAEAHLLLDPQIAPVGATRADATIQLNRTEYPERNLSILDILPAGCSKGEAILRLAAARGIVPAEIMAIGDNWNDLSMLEVAGHPVLMGNAPADLLEHAAAMGWQVAPPHDVDGVADMIEPHVLTMVGAEGSH